MVLISGATSTIMAPVTGQSVAVIIEEGSYLTIKGRTNVNTFRCHYEGNIGQDTIHVRVWPRSDGTMALENAHLSVMVDRFNCGNKVINRDFRKLLRHEQYPSLRLDVLKLHSEPGTSTSSVVASVKFTIGDQENTFRVPVEAVHDDKGVGYRGQKVLDITDFGLAPPRKFLGMVVVDQEVVVDFRLNLRWL